MRFLRTFAALRRALLFCMERSLRLSGREDCKSAVILVERGNTNQAGTGSLANVPSSNTTNNSFVPLLGKQAATRAATPKSVGGDHCSIRPARVLSQWTRLLAE